MVYALPTGWVCKSSLCVLWFGVSKVLYNSRSIRSLRAATFTVKYSIKRRNRLFSVLFHSKTYCSVMMYPLPTGWVCKPRLYELCVGVSKVLHKSQSIRSLRAGAFTVKYPIKRRNRLFSVLFTRKHTAASWCMPRQRVVCANRVYVSCGWVFRRFYTIPGAYVASVQVLLL